MTSLHCLNIRNVFDKALNTVADVLLSTPRIQVVCQRSPARAMGLWMIRSDDVRFLCRIRCYLAWAMIDASLVMIDPSLVSYLRIYLFSDTHKDLGSYFEWKIAARTAFWNGCTYSLELSCSFHAGDTTTVHDTDIHATPKRPHHSRTRFLQTRFPNCFYKMGQVGFVSLLVRMIKT